MRKKVMVIDDDKNAVKFLSVLLSENGYEPIVAHDGQEGLQKIEEQGADLIVLDVMMPKKTGFVLFKQLKTSDEYKDIPILMLTAVAESLMELDAEKEDTFERPYDSLRETLRKAIQEMRESGDVKPEMFVDKPVDPDALHREGEGAHRRLRRPTAVAIIRRRGERAGDAYLQLPSDPEVRARSARWDTVVWTSCPFS